MLNIFNLFLVSNLISLSLASPLTSRNNTGSNSGLVYATCRDFYADISTYAQNVDLSGVLPQTPADEQVIVEYFLRSVAAGSTSNQQIASAPKRTIDSSYKLWFEYCTPLSGTPKGLFQTVHGIQGNAGYWNVVVDGNSSYSFADAAAKAGWATLSYDRLGVGRSDHPDGISVTQIPVDIAQAVSIANSVRKGNLSDIGTFDKIVAVGHSYGSLTLLGAASTAPTAFNATVLTGFSNTPLPYFGVFAFASVIASQAYPSRFSGLSNDYIIAPTINIDQQEFFHYPNYSYTALQQFTATKGEYSIGQASTISATYMQNRTSYTRPLQVVTGNYDTPFCAANCSATMNGTGTQLDAVKTLFPSVPASSYNTYIVPDTGHGINFHYTAPLAYQEIVRFVQGVGL